MASSTMNHVTTFIPPFDFHQVFIQPWTDYGTTFVWVAIMGFLVTTACGVIGNYLVLRRMSLVGDAISHSVLPGMAIAFFFTRSLASWPMFIGALGAGIVTTLIIEVIHTKSRVKQDSAIGITFSTLFAFGVILIVAFADKVHLDQECVLYGEINFIPLYPFTRIGDAAIAPEPVFVMGIVTLFAITLIMLFYKELLVSSFDPGLATSIGLNPHLIHYGLMCLLSVVVVSAFESVGAILVIAMLILPAATAYLLSHRLPVMMGLTIVHALLSSLVGLHLGIWLNSSIAASMVVAGASLFVLAWWFNPDQGLLWRLFKKRLDPIYAGERDPT